MKEMRKTKENFEKKPNKRHKMDLLVLMVGIVYKYDTAWHGMAWHGMNERNKTTHKNATNQIVNLVCVLS